MRAENDNLVDSLQNHINEEIKQKDYRLNSKWNKIEDSYLNELVSYFGLNNINIVYQSFKLMFPGVNKTLEECVKRWNEINKKVRIMSEYTGFEELELIKLHMKYHNNWTILGVKLGNRKGNQVKNHFYSMFRKILRKIQKRNYNYSKSRLEHVQALYIIDLIGKYILKPHEMKALSTNRKSKNHVLTLVKTIPYSELQEYKENFKSTFHITTLEELIAEVDKSLAAPQIVAPPVVNPTTPLSVTSLRTLPSPFDTFIIEKSFFENEKLSISGEDKETFIQAITKDLTSSYALSSIKNSQSFNSSLSKTNVKLAGTFRIASNSFK